MARILVVEAEPLLTIMLESSLSDFGYHVLGPVENLKAAIYLAATEHIDAAIVDTNIDGQIAEAVADKLMERGIPFVFIIGRGRMFNLYYSAIPRLQKPFTIDDLQRTITRLSLSRLYQLSLLATHLRYCAGLVPTIQVFDSIRVFEPACPA